MRKKIIERMPENVAFARKCLLFFSVFLLIVGVVLWIARGGYYMQWVYGVSVIGVGFFFLINYIVSIYFYGAALAKGYDDLVFLLLPFFFGIIGCLFVIAMPNTKNISELHSETKIINESSQLKDTQEESSVSDLCKTDIKSQNTDVGSDFVKEQTTTEEEIPPIVSVVSTIIVVGIVLILVLLAF